MFKPGDKVRAKYTGWQKHAAVARSGNATVVEFREADWDASARDLVHNFGAVAILFADSDHGWLCWPSNMIMGWADPPAVRSMMLAKVLDAYRDDPMVQRRDELLAELFKPVK